MNEDIVNIGIKLIKHITSRQAEGMTDTQIQTRLSDELFNFKSLIEGQAISAATVFSEVILRASQEIDEKRLRNAQAFLSTYIDPSWSEESKVKITEAQIKSDSVNSTVEKATIGAVASIAVGGLAWILKTFVDNKTKPKKWWEK